MGINVRKGTVILIREIYPCRVVEIAIAKTGKHGSAKAIFTGLDIFTEKKHEELTTTHSKIPEVIVEHEEYSLIDISDDYYLSLMTNEGEIRSDLKLPAAKLHKDVRGRILSCFEMGKDCNITVMKAMGQEMPVNVKMA